MTENVEQKIKDFFASFPSITYQKREIILHPNASFSDVFFLKKGKVRMYAISPEGEEVTLHIFLPYSYFPLMLLLSERSNTYYFEALEEVIIEKAPYTVTLDFIKSHPEVLYELTQRFSNAICGLLTRIENLAFEQSFTKVIHLLIYLAEKFGQKNGTDTIIQLPLSHEDIANWVGLRRETVSRQIEILQKDSLVSIRNKKINIADINKLKLFINSNT